ncbi:hypothetical protein D3C85_617250 [compost metagenome]
MAAVAGHVDHLVALGNLLHALDVVDLDAVVDLVPEPAEQQFEKADRRVGVVRGDLVAVAQGHGFGFVQADVFALGVLDDRLAHLRTVHQALDQVAPVRHIGADDRGLLLAKVHPQDALNHAQGALVALVLRDQFTQLDRA